MSFCLMQFTRNFTPLRITSGGTVLLCRKEDLKDFLEVLTTLHTIIYQIYQLYDSFCFVLDTLLKISQDFQSVVEKMKYGAELSVCQ